MIKVKATRIFDEKRDFSEYPKVSFDGNPSHESILAPLYRDVRDTLDDGTFFEEFAYLEEGEDSFSCFLDLIYAYFPPQGREEYTLDELDEWRELLRNYESKDSISRICKVMTLISKETYDWTSINDSPSGEWQIVIFPVEDYTDGSLNLLGRLYFISGPTWSVLVTGEKEKWVATFSDKESIIVEQIIRAAKVKPPCEVELCTLYNVNADYSISSPWKKRRGYE